MPFYIRKSISVGPFRLNFSKGGVGMSVGVKGLRLGTGPRGHYVHAGRGGLYYRASLGRPGEKRRSPAAPSRLPEPLSQPAPVQMVEVESGDVLEMRDATVAELVDDINAKARQAPLGRTVGWLGIIFGGLAMFADAALGLSLWALTLPAWLFARWLDSYQRKSAVFYDLETDATAAYEQLTKAFDEMMACGGKWHVAAGGQVQDLTTWKRNAGATHIVDKKPTTLAFALPKVVVSNVTPPSVLVGAQTLYFMPDVVLVAHGAKMGAVGYGDLQLTWEPSNFIETGAVPSDATVIGHTWKHPNKSGGPDRRFRENYQIPICRYETLHLRSTTGLNELLEFSRTEVSAALDKAVRELAWASGRNSPEMGARAN
jgi:hypothetical protein